MVMEYPMGKMKILMETAYPDELEPGVPGQPASF